MIWGETRDQRRERLPACGPSPWFAWHPVTLKDGRSAWLTTVMRRRIPGVDYWFYEAPNPTPLPDSRSENTGGRDGR